MGDAVKKDGPCQVDLLNRREIITHFRDLANIGPMLDWDLGKVRGEFCAKLMEAGWSDEEIKQMEMEAYKHTIYEKDLPRPPRDLGNYMDYICNKGRTR